MAEPYDQPLDHAIPADSTLEQGASVVPGTPEAQRIARELVERHRKAKARKKKRDLTAEKYMLHVDGEGDGQWAEIRGGTRVEVPPRFGRVRISQNHLEPIFEDWISYHTSEPVRFAVDGPSDRKSRDRNRVNTLLVNHISQHQRVNATLAQAMQMAGVYGMCPVHSSWRDDLTSDPYEPVYQHEGMQGPKPQKGFVDVWVGDPFGTTFNAGSKLGSIQMMAYERVLPAKMVRFAFSHVPGIESLQGSDKVASASVYQRIGGRWQIGSRYDSHGTAILESGEPGNEELVTLICEELERGVDPDSADGYYRIVAVSGNPSREDMLKSGQALLLHEGPLPGGVMSAELFYAGFRQDDVLGKPFMSGGLDDGQVVLNQYLTLAAEWSRKHAHPPIVVAGQYAIPEDMAMYDDDVIIELAGDQGSVTLLTPNFANGGTPYDSAINDWREYMFRKGGWQAASRGESDASSPAAKVVALARADDSIRGTTVRAYKASCAKMAKRWHALAKQYMDVPWLVNVTGEDISYLADPYIRQEQLSETSPEFKVVSGFGNSPESKAEQLTNMAMTKLADGGPMLTRQQMWERWPDDSMRPTETDVRKLKVGRAEALLYAIEKAATEGKQEMQEISAQFGGQMPPEWGKQALQVAVAHVRQQFPMRADDDPQIMADKLSELTQDPDADPLMQEIAAMIQMEYVQRLMMAQAQAAGQPQQKQAPKGGAGGPGVEAKKNIAGSPSSDAMNNVDGAVQELTNAARSA